MRPRSLGFDLAMNHSAAVVTEQGNPQPLAWWFLTDSATVHRASPECSHFFKREGKARDPESLWARLQNFWQWTDYVFESAAPFRITNLGVENYAMGKAFNAYHIGEFGGVFRAAAMRSGFGRVELVRPDDVKERAGLSRRSKEKPIAFCLEAWGADWSVYDAGLATSDAAGDLADAHVVSVIAGERAES